LENPIATEDNRAADYESNIEQINGIEDPECPEHQDISAAPNALRVVWPTWNLKIQAETVLVTVKAIETRRNKGVKRMLDRSAQWFASFFTYFDGVFQLEIYYG